MTLQLEGKTALVTGAASGIGRAVARALPRRRARTSSPSTGWRRTWSGEAVAGSCASVVGDVRSAADNQRAVDLAVEPLRPARRLRRQRGHLRQPAAAAQLLGGRARRRVRRAVRRQRQGLPAGRPAPPPTRWPKARGCILFTSSVSGAPRRLRRCALRGRQARRERTDQAARARARAGHPGQRGGAGLRADRPARPARAWARSASTPGPTADQLPLQALAERRRLRRAPTSSSRRMPAPAPPPAGARARRRRGAARPAPLACSAANPRTDDGARHDAETEQPATTGPASENAPAAAGARQTRASARSPPAI